MILNEINKKLNINVIGAIKNRTHKMKISLLYLVTILHNCSTENIMTAIIAIAAVITLIFLIIRHFSSRPNVKVTAKYQNYIKQSDCIELKIINKSSKIFVIDEIKISPVKKDRNKLDARDLMIIGFIPELHKITLPYKLMPDGEFIEPFILTNLVKDFTTSKNVKFIVVVKNSLGKEFKSNIIDAKGF